MNLRKYETAGVFFRAFAAMIVAVLTSVSSFAAGGDFKGDFERANQLYDQGKYDEARKLYQSIVDGRHYSPEVFYNLGNTEFRLKDTGRAVLDYERALALSPNDAEARANLAYAREQTGASVPAKDWQDRIVADLDVNTYAWTAACAAWIGIFALAVIWLKMRSDNLAPSLAVFCCVVVLGYALFAIYHLQRDQSLAIVTAKAEARYAPADNSTLAATLPVGSRVWIRERRGPWIYCTLPDSNRAWVPSESVEHVRLKDS